MNWWPRKKDPAAPVDNQPGLAKYLQIWQLLNKIPLQQLWPALVSTTGIVFLAISGLIAWLVVLVAFICKLFKIVS